MNIQSTVKRAVASRHNYDWLALVVGIVGVLQTANLSFLSPQVSGAILIVCAVLNVVVAWYRAQSGVGGQAGLPKDTDDGSDSGV